MSSNPCLSNLGVSSTLISKSHLSGRSPNCFSLKYTTECQIGKKKIYDGAAFPLVEGGAAALPLCVLRHGGKLGYTEFLSRVPKSM